MSLQFNSEYYLAQNPDVAAAVASGKITAKEHWEKYGSKEGRDPNESFDTSYYLSQNPDVASSGMNPLTHFLKFGAAEGRAPSAAAADIAATFDEEAYRTKNPDVAKAIDAGKFNSGYQHWVLYGQGEGREAVTDSGNGNIPSVDNTFTLTEIPTQREATLDISDVDASLMLAFLEDFTDLDLAGLGLLDENGNLTGVENINVTDNTATNSADSDGSASININLTNGGQLSAFAEDYLALIANIIENFAEEGETITQTGIVLTTSKNNGGAFEDGYTTSGDDLIVAGRPELLHGAYIDGGAGYNTLEVDMKGFFAQPFQLHNIQEVQVQNLKNVYNVNQTILDGAMSNFPIPDAAELTGADSLLDLSRARDLEKLVITEGFNAGGGLTIAGIQNYATTRLEGNFDGDVDLFFGRGQTDLLTVELANVSFGGDFSVNQNVGAVELVSEGRVNTLENVDFGGNFVELIVSGTGMLSIEDDLQFGFGEASIDASANTGGVRLTVSSQTDFGTLEEITIVGSQGRDVFTLDESVADGALLNIDTGAGRDTLVIDAAVSVGEGSVITGDNLTVQVNANADLREADVSGVDRFVIAVTGGLLLNQAQVEELGAAVFVADHNTQPVVTIEVTEAGTVLSDLIDLSALDSDVKLAFDVKAGASLTLTAEELHTYLAEDGVAGEGTVNVTDAGLGFDVDDSTGAIGEGVGSIVLDADGGNFDGDLNVERTADGFERPALVGGTDQLVIDTTDTGGVEVDANDLAGPGDNEESFSTNATTVVIEGSDDITFNVPVEMLADDFTLDFSGLTGALNNLTIENFNEVEEVIGNGAEGVRINVSLEGDVAQPGNDSGLQSSGVEQYVVVDLNGADRAFNVCDNTQDVEVLGLQGNAGNTLTFTNIPWGSVNPTILFEGDGFADWSELPKAAGNPNESNVGTIDAEYFFAGAPANVLITNQGVALGETSTGEARSIVVDGIELANAQSLNVTVEDGNSVIDSLSDDGSLEDVTITSAFDVQLDLDNGNSGLESINADAVAGTMTLLVEDTDVNLSDAELSGIDAVVLDNSDDGDVLTNDDVALTLTIEQIQAIGAENFSAVDTSVVAAEADLNIGNYDGQAFDFSALALEGIDVNIVTVVEGADFVVDAATDFTGVGELVIPTGSNVTISAEQYQQLVASGATITTGPVNGDLEAGSLTVDLNGDLTIGAADLQSMTSNNVLDIDGDFIDGAALSDRANVTFDMADGETLNVELLALANALQVAGDEAAATTPLVNFLFDSDANVINVFDDTIDVADYQGVDVRILDQLLNFFQVGGNNSQAIEQLLVNLDNANILNIFAEEAEVIVEDPRDRTVVVEADAVPNGIDFEPGTGADYVREVNLTLQANADDAATVNGDITIADSRLEAGFTTLTITTEDVDGAAVGPATIGVDGTSTISVENAVEDVLTDVVINAAVDLNITGTIVFNAVEAGSTATLTVTGDADVTIKALNTIDTDITGLTVDTTGYTGTLTITGGSDALEIDGTESLVFVGSGDVVLDTNDDSVQNNGVEGNILTSIDASGLTGTLTVGVIEDVDSTNFTFTGAQGATTLTLGHGVTLDANETATDPAEPGWTFNLSADDTLTITEGANLNGGALTVTGGTIAIEGNVDLTALVDGDGNSLLDFEGATIELLDGATVQMTDAQFEAFEAAGGTIAGDTVLEVTQAFIDANGSDLTELRGFTAIQVDNGLSVTMTGEQALITSVYDSLDEETRELGAAGDLSDATINVEVAEDLDLSAVSGMTTLMLLDTGDVETFVTVELSAAEASQLVGNITRQNNDGADVDPADLDQITVTFSGDAINPEGLAAEDVADATALGSYDFSEVNSLTLDGDLTLSIEQVAAILGAQDEETGEFAGEIVKNSNALNVVVTGTAGDFTTVGDLFDTIDLVDGAGVTLTLAQAEATQVWDANPYDTVDAAAGERGVLDTYVGTVTVAIDGDADLRTLTLANNDVIQVAADLDPAPSLQVTADQVELLRGTDVNGDAEALEAADFADLAVEVEFELDNPLGDAPIVDTRTVTFTNSEDGLAVAGNAAAIAVLDSAPVGGGVVDTLLGAADTIEWKAVGGTLTSDVTLNARAGVDTFEIIESPTTDNGGFEINAFESGITGDVLDFTAFLGEAYTYAGKISETGTVSVDITGQVALFNDAAGVLDNTDFGDSTQANVAFDDFEGQAVVVGNDGSIWFVDSAATGDATTIEDGDITLVGSVNGATYAEFGAYNVGVEIA